MFNRVDVKIYQAVKMTGRSAKGVVEQTTRARRLFQNYVITVLGSQYTQTVKAQIQYPAESGGAMGEASDITIQEIGGNRKRV